MRHWTERAIINVILDELRRLGYEPTEDVGG